MKLLRTPRMFWGRRQGRNSSELLALFTDLREAQLAFAQAAGGLEGQFLAIGSELESLTGLGNQFVKQVESLVGLATGKNCDNSLFSSAIRLIEESSRFLIGYQQQTSRMLDLLRSYNLQIGKLLAVEAELQRTLLPLKFVQTLFKAESAPLGSEVQQMFSALTQEIDGLHGRVREIFGTKFKQLEQTRGIIGQVVAQLERQAKLLQEATATQQARIEASLGTLRKELGSNQERDVRLSRLSKDLAREVEQVVFGLQFQDIVNQKVQHVTAALPQIEARFTEFRASPETACGSEPLQFVYHSCRLEAGQLQAAQEELAKAETIIRSGVQKVLSHLTEMDSQCLSLEEFKLLTTSFDGMVQVLIEMIEEVRNLVLKTVDRAAEAYELLRPLGSLASDLTAVVRDVSAQIHLIALNAQVQAALAAQNRRGAGLGVLSARTTEISGETSRISEQAGAQLDQLAVGLAQSVQSFERLRAEGLAQQAMLNEQGRTEEQQLHAFRDRALATLRDIGSSLDNIQEQAQRTLATIQFADFHQVTIPALRAPLVAIADAAERLLRAQGCDLGQGSLVEGFQREYTMASEREVFTSIVPRAESPSAPPQSAEPVKPRTELFIDPAADMQEEPSGPSEQKQEALAASASAATPGGGDLGANVELF